MLPRTICQNGQSVIMVDFKNANLTNEYKVTLNIETANGKEICSTNEFKLIPPKVLKAGFLKNIETIDQQIRYYIYLVIQLCTTKYGVRNLDM